MNEEKSFFGFVKTINREDKTIEIVASTSEIDRDNEVIEPQAFAQTIDSFKSNPVILACHQHRLQSGESPVIGSAIPDTIQIGAKDLRFKMRFADTSLGENYWRLYRDKHMRACSIGFIPIEGTSQRAKGKDVYHHTKIELLEVSLVPVPSNRQALARAKQLGWLEAKKDQHEEEKILAEIRKEYESQGKDFDQENDEFAEALLGVGKYANSETIKSLQDEDGDNDDELIDLPDFSVLVSR